MASANILANIGFSDTQAAHLGYTLEFQINAFGLTQVDSYQLFATTNRIQASVANGGVRLPNSVNSPYGVILVSNQSANTIKIWPYFGDLIYTIAVDNPTTLVAGGRLEFYKDTTNGQCSWLMT